MFIELFIANINFKIYSNQNLIINNKLKKYIGNINTNDNVEIYFQFQKEDSINYHSNNIFHKYYSKDNVYYFFTEDIKQQFFSVCEYDSSCKEFRCSISFTSSNKILNLESLLRLIPMDFIFYSYDILMFHASQIVLNKSDGILFTASSGVGKTTQSKLWQEFEPAKIVCNDRTLVRKLDGKWKTFGFYVDGSEPICSNKVNDLKSIVYLSQQKDNRIERLSVIKSINYLKQQIIVNKVYDCSIDKKVGQLLEIINDIPIYHLGCTPDERAVSVLKEKLKEDEVIEFGS